MKTKSLTSTEIKQIINSHNISERDKCYVIISSTTGLRVSEVLSIKISQVAYLTSKGDLRIKDNLIIDKSEMKGKKNSREIRLDNDVRVFLKNYIRMLFKSNKYDFNMDSYLIHSRESKGKTKMKRVTAWRIVKALAEQVLGYSVRVGTHSFRKFFCNAKMAITKNINEVRILMGHKQLATTLLYLDEQVYK